jgi:hypothetical protein
MSGRPTVNDVEELDTVTTGYIRPLIYYVYDDALAFFALTRESSVLASDGPRITFVPHVKFLEETLGAPESHVMNQLRQAFTEEHYVENYIKELQRLDPSNPFQQVTQIHFSSSFEESIYDSSIRQQIRGSRKAATNGGLVGGFVGAFILLCVSGHLIHGRRGILQGRDEIVERIVASQDKAATAVNNAPISVLYDLLRDPRQLWQHTVNLGQAEDVSVITESSGEDEESQTSSRSSVRAWRLARPQDIA